MRIWENFQYLLQESNSTTSRKLNFFLQETWKVNIFFNLKIKK